MENAILLGVLALFACVRATSDHIHDVRCLRCDDVSSPDMCLTSEQCALDEVCFTREIFDHQGRRAFRLGCESKALCNLAQSAHAFGRRGENDDDDDDDEEDDDRTGGTPRTRTSNLCFECCASNECNILLCENVLDKNRTDHSGHLGGPTHCPPDFIKGPNSCLHFSTSPANWPTARKECRKLGADLVKIDDKAEDGFIVAKLRTLSLRDPSAGYWTGGHMDKVTKEFRWLDGSLVNYTRWSPVDPSRVEDAIYIIHPSKVWASISNDWSWGDIPVSVNGGYICEK